MECDDIVAYYTFQNGEIFLSAIADRIKTKKQINSAQYVLHQFIHLSIIKFFKKIHPRLIKMFKELKVDNGVMAIQFFVDNENFYAYDPGFRLQVGGYAHL